MRPALQFNLGRRRPETSLGNGSHAFLTLTAPAPLLHEHFAHNRRRGLWRYIGGLLAYPSLAWRHRVLVQNFPNSALLDKGYGTSGKSWWKFF